MMKTDFIEVIAPLSGRILLLYEFDREYEFDRDNIWGCLPPSIIHALYDYIDIGTNEYWELYKADMTPYGERDTDGGCVIYAYLISCIPVD